MKYYLNGERIKEAQALAIIKGYARNAGHDEEEIESIWRNRDDEENRDILAGIADYQIEFAECWD